MLRTRPRSTMPDDGHTDHSAVQNGAHTHPLAEIIGERGLTVPAIVALQTARPLAWMAGQFLWIAQPFLHSLKLGRRGTLSLSSLAQLLENDAGIDSLIHDLTAYSPRTRQDGPE
ncbi:MAG: hypothetical protein IVW55_13910 [Chloroflexi bacterium]|nr:hypothetical protein [Chloroflexota bacterium]